MPKSPRILLVDDTPAIHDDFRKVLGAAPLELTRALDADLFDDAPPAPHHPAPTYRIDSAMQGLDAVALVEAAKAANDPFSLAFVDVRMPPGLDGIETIARLWNVDLRLEIVICSAYSDYTWHRLLEKLARPRTVPRARQAFREHGGPANYPRAQ